ncbi:YceD family protein [Cognatazoarcus halotolerans]|uniref:YceD family protein n=1 Tax=Cognatazoarcus halotolerans TaxID=2686016 RepID=UPI00135BB6C1|nr:DUF177 domain-containing protein [Cognatazoarcus halotolerans]MBX3679156.1 DUF177 domain-containing protein [Rhodocyclaceae bacterium]MCB1898050.1 DUF177 domain-containing protein [Rhodocyclaceae bacterium]MCP5309258.1 DUF177 domain-containing protein [Zoogloeaceae bacterium]
MSQESLNIDPLAFARDHGQRAGELAVAAFERLADVRVSDVGSVRYVASGRLDGEGQRWLSVHLEGALQLRCQRCLEAVDWHFDLDSRLMLVPEGRALPDEMLEEDDWDPIPVGARLDLLALFEDEVLLAMPAAPRHESCVAPSRVDGDDRITPFAALAKLRSREV